MRLVRVEAYQKFQLRPERADVLANIARGAAIYALTVAKCC